MVFANKYSDKLSDKLDVSLFVAWAQCVSTVLVVVALVAFRRLVLGHDIELPPLSREILLNRDFLLLSCMFTGMLTFNNLCLKYVGVAFFQKVAGTLSTVWRHVRRVDLAVRVAQRHLHEARLLDMISKNQALAVTYYMNIGGSILFMPLLICFGQFSAAYSSRGTTDFSFLLLLALSGIDYTSPVTHHISNNTKAVLQTLLAVFVYSEHKSAILVAEQLPGGGRRLLLHHGEDARGASPTRGRGSRAPPPRTLVPDDRRAEVSDIVRVVSSSIRWGGEVRHGRAALPVLGAAVPVELVLLMEPPVDNGG
uniref:ABC transmembrane type-1 domain-containing protein n=1 Tax=Macrostomum lignano TaxID=282301 RepID=A0A1I8HMY9_9PLAT